MVRFNALKRSNIWNVDTFGIPIPQVDQMPAGLIGTFLLAFKITAKGRFEYTPVERARVELSRYRCFLLGLPEELAPATPKDMVDMMVLYEQTLRKGFDDKTCGELTRATLAAYLPPDEKLGSKIFDRIERRFSKIFFLLSFLGGDKKKAAEMGVKIGALDWATWDPCPAGSHPAGKVNAHALRTLERLRLPAEGYRSKNWDEFAKPDSPALDFVLTVCDKAAGEMCPVWPGQPMTAHWGVADPAAFEGSEEATERQFMDTALTLKRRIELMLALPLARLDSMAIQREIRDIGKAQKAAQ
jgi:arsenate reductase